MKINGKFRNIIIFLVIIVLASVMLRFFISYKEKIKYDTSDLKQNLATKKSPSTIKKEEKVARKITTSKQKKKPKVKVKIRRIAIIIDDVGYPSKNIERFLDCPEKLTFAVLPFLEESTLYAKRIHDRGFEVMVHIPMEPIDNYNHNPGPGAIYRNDNPEVINYKLEKMLENIPFAKGANNHMGSYITADEPQIKLILTFLKHRDFYFVDSLTTSKSKAYLVGQNLGIQVLKRDVFIDNEDDYSKIILQLRRLKDIAEKRGYAIGIGHIHKKYTIQAIEDMIPELEKDFFKLVFVSELFNSTSN